MDCEVVSLDAAALDALKSFLLRVCHELSFLHGLRVTDRPDLVGECAVSWDIDTGKLTAEAEEVFRAIFGIDMTDPGCVV